jgi:tetratricopeptide (TPR) repeat protein
MPPAQAPDAQGVALFQQAMEALQRKRYGLAADRFRSLLKQFPAERALRDRTRVYLDLAERELNRQPANPRTLEERVTAATAALNNEQYADAERLVRSVLAEDARHDLALYLMAAIEARRDEVEAALSYLGRAIAISPEVRAQARHDADFERLRNSEAFQTLVDPPSAPSGSRKLRRGHRI